MMMMMSSILCKYFTSQQLPLALKFLYISARQLPRRTSQIESRHLFSITHSSNGESKSKAETTSDENISEPKVEKANDALIQLREKLEKAEIQLSEHDQKFKGLHKNYLATLADMENLRARTRKEVENASHYSISKFAKDLLNIADVLELAIKNVPSALLTTCKDSTTETDSQLKHSLKNLYEGLQLTYHELIHVLKRHGVEPFESLNEPFDANIHSALFEVPSANQTGIAKVIEEQKKGYKLKNRILRHAQVGISKS